MPDELFTPVTQPSSASDANRIVVLEEGVETHTTKSYGIGIDCHSKFIQVSVLAKRNFRIYEYRREFGTDWKSLVEAKQWCIAVLGTCSIPPITFGDDSTIPFHYCIESTSNYHQPILQAWKGTPCVVNPTIAGATKRKTDVLDAKLLALQDLTGVWAESYIPTRSVQEVRLLLAESFNYKENANRTSSRINNALLRFGYTIGRNGSVTKSKTVRAIVEDQISESPSDDFGNLCPLGIPDDVRPAFRDEYEQYDQCRNLSRKYESAAIVKVREMLWETRESKLPGDEMIRILTTAPAIGETTAAVWLAYIITPNRFPNAKAVAAYCGLDPGLKISAKKVTSTVKRGGNKQLHKMLCMCASILVKNHNEMFGRWGYNLYCQTSRWKKATNAVARKLAVALYYMQSSGQPFSYDKYKLIQDAVVVDISLERLAELNSDFKRYVRPLKEAGIETTNDLIHKYYSCQLKPIRGLGKKFFSLIKDFIYDQKRYRQLLNPTT